MRILESKEVKTRGSQDFPVEAYDIDWRHPRYVMPLHWHEEHEIIRVAKGAFHYHIGQEKGVAGPGDILYVNGGEFHAGVPVDCEYRCVVFDFDLLAKSNAAVGKLLMPFVNGDMHILLRPPDGDGEIGGIIQRLFGLLLGEAGGNPLQVQGLLLCLIGGIIQKRHIHRETKDNLTKRNLSQLKSVISFVDRNYAQPVTLPMLAREAGMSPKYFCTFFKQMTGFSPIEYLNRQRIDVACYQLMSGRRHITGLAYECGFNDLSYFIRVFKKVVGMTPKQYAAKYKSGAFKMHRPASSALDLDVEDAAASAHE